MGLALAYGSDSAVSIDRRHLRQLLAMSLSAAFSPSASAATVAGTAHRRCCLLAYIPGFLVAIAAEAFGYAAENMAAVIPLVSDQLLLAVLNLGLIAMPGERAQAILARGRPARSLTGAWNRAGLRLIGARLVARRPERRLLDRLRTRRDGGEPQFAAHWARRPRSSPSTWITSRRSTTIMAMRRRPCAGRSGAEARNLARKPEAILVVRLGGDEFAMVLPDKSLAEARWLADEIRRTIRLTPDLPVWTISLGVAAVEPGETDLPTSSSVPTVPSTAPSRGPGRAAA